MYRSEPRVPARRALPAAPPPPDDLVVTALDLISWPFAFVAVAALAPFQWLIGTPKPKA